MSLILEALKKSEQQRRLGEMPTLSTPAPSRRQRRSALPWLAVLVVLALAAGWWLSRDGAPPATVAEAPPAPSASTPAAGPATEAPAAASPRQRKALPAAERAAAAPAGADTVHIPDPAGPDRPGAVVDLPPAGPVASAPTQVPPPATEMSRPASARPSRPAQRNAAEPAASATPLPSTAPATPTAAPAQPAAAAPAAAAPPAAPAQPALPSVWELPYAVRRDLPPIALTMHVWSSDPAGRFVVIDGERHVEGDELENGVIVREIRADGLVLEFQGHRFTYPRDGR